MGGCRWRKAGRRVGGCGRRQAGRHVNPFLTNTLTKCWCYTETVLCVLKGRGNVMWNLTSCVVKDGDFWHEKIKVKEL